MGELYTTKEIAKYLNINEKNGVFPDLGERVARHQGHGEMAVSH